MIADESFRKIAIVKKCRSAGVSGGTEGYGNRELSRIAIAAFNDHCLANYYFALPGPDEMLVDLVLLTFLRYLGTKRWGRTDVRFACKVFGVNTVIPRRPNR